MPAALEIESVKNMSGAPAAKETTIEVIDMTGTSSSNSSDEGADGTHSTAAGAASSNPSSLKKRPLAEFPPAGQAANKTAKVEPAPTTAFGAAASHSVDEAGAASSAAGAASSSSQLIAVAKSAARSEDLDSANPLLRLFLRLLPALDRLPLAPQPKTLKTQLRNYQRQAVQWMLDRELQGLRGKAAGGKAADLGDCAIVSPIRGGILADEMGLGKSLELMSLLLLNAGSPRDDVFTKDAGLLTPAKTTLIICPQTLLSQVR